MKKISKIISGVALLLAPGIAFAETITLNKNSTSAQDFSLNLIYTTALPVLSVVALGSIIWGAVNIVMAGGDENKVSKGRMIITYSIVGILLILCAYGIINWLGSFLYQSIK